MLRIGFTASLFSFFVLVACSSSTETASQPTAATDPTPPAPAPPAGKDAGTVIDRLHGTTCNEGKSCGEDATCVTGGGDEGFCALACDPKVGCAYGLRCSDVGGRGTVCLETCSDDDDCAKGFICSKTVGVVVGRAACIRSCEGVADYCGADATCQANGTCPAKFTCDVDASGVATDKTLGTLSSADRGKVCDFTACAWGGYGKELKCDNGFTMSSPDSKSECTSRKTWSQCAAVTVGEYEACEKKMRVDQCKALEILTTDPDCASLKACAM